MNYDLNNQVVDFTISFDRKFITIYTPSSVKEMYNSIMDIHSANNEPQYSCDLWKMHTRNGLVLCNIPQNHITRVSILMFWHTEMYITQKEPRNCRDTKNENISEV